MSGGSEELCTNIAEKYESYDQIRCADQRTKGLVIILLVIYVLITNLVRTESHIESYKQ